MWILFFIATVLMGTAGDNQFRLVKPTRCASLGDAELISCTVHSVGHCNDGSERQKVIVVERGAVVDDGLIVTLEGAIVRDLIRYDDQNDHSLYSLYRSVLKGPALDQWDHTMYEGSLAVILSEGPGNYYHWLLQILPRISTLVQSNVPYDRIYVPHLNAEWQRSTLYAVLDHFSIAREKLFFSDPSVVFARTLIVPSVSYIPAKGQLFPLWVRDMLQEIFLKKSSFSQEKNRRVAISRKNASYRHIANEMELSEVLEENGFRIVCLEELSVFEQARLFADAEIIVAPHGAGLANLVFCKSGTHIIEIDHASDEPRSHFRVLSRRLGLLYHPFYTDHRDDDHMEDDIVVDRAAFKRHLEEVLKKGLLFQKMANS